MNTRVKLLYTSFLLCLALVLTFFTATSTIQAYQHFQQNHRGVQSGDVTTVDSWMTIPYIAHVYHVPELCFTQTLHLSNKSLVAHATLRTIADHYHWPMQTLIQNVQQVILHYRQKQLACDPAPKTSQAPGMSEHLPLFTGQKGLTR